MVTEDPTSIPITYEPAFNFLSHLEFLMSRDSMSSKKAPSLVKDWASPLFLASTPSPSRFRKGIPFFRRDVYKRQPILFLALSITMALVAGLNFTFLLNEVITRLARNSLLVLSLLIPVTAGMGLNFGIVIGAMAGQASVIAVTYWGITGVRGFLLEMCIRDRA